MATVTYLRVSSEEQAETGLGLDAQLRACEAWAVQHGGLGPVFRDEGRSGGLPLEKREVLLDAIATLRKGDVLLVSKLDRLSRGDGYDVGLIERAVAKRGARIISAVGEGTADDSADSITQREFHRLINRRELLIGKERTKAALHSKKLRGERYGQVPYGMRLGDSFEIERRDRKGRLVRKTSFKLEPAPEDLVTLAEIRRLRSEGRSLRMIAERMNFLKVPSKSGKPWRHTTIAEICRKDMPP